MLDETLKFLRRTVEVCEVDNKERIFSTRRVELGDFLADAWVDTEVWSKIPDVLNDATVFCGGGASGLFRYRMWPGEGT